MIALTDCSPIVIAHEKGLFKKYGINSTVSKGASWAAIRDSLSNGDIQATHMLLGMPIASTMGLLGSPKKPMVIPWLLNRNGQAITLKAALKGKVAADPKALKPLVDAAKAAGDADDLRHDLPARHARDVDALLARRRRHQPRQGRLAHHHPAAADGREHEGRQDGRLLRRRAVERARRSPTASASPRSPRRSIWKDHPEKVCAFTAEFAEKNPKTVKAVLKALHEASVWLDDMKNRPEQAEIVSRPTYINCPPELILGRLQGNYDFGDGRKKRGPELHDLQRAQLQLPAAEVRGRGG